MTLSEVEKLAPGINWKEYFTIRGARGFGEINVAQPDFFKALNKSLDGFSIDEWKTYLRWHVFDFAAAYLPKKSEDANFDFYSRYLKGAKQQLPRTKQCVAQTNAHLVNATLANMPEFSEAFGCRIGDKMVRSEKERCRVW